MKNFGKINCSFVRKNLVHFFLDELDENIKIAMNQHLVSCEDCKKDEGFMQASIDKLKHYEDISPSEHLYKIISKSYRDKFQVENSLFKKALNFFHLSLQKPLPVYGGLLIFLIMLVGYLYFTPINQNLTIHGNIKLFLSDSSFVDSLSQKFNNSDTLSLEGKIIESNKQINHNKPRLLYNIYFTTQDNLHPPAYKGKLISLNIISRLQHIKKYRKNKYVIPETKINRIMKVPVCT